MVIAYLTEYTDASTLDATHVTHINYAHGRFGNPKTGDGGIVISETSLLKKVLAHAAELGIEVEIVQSNHEGALVDAIQEAYGRADGIVLNPAAYTHTSVALLDALKAVSIRTVEVHITRPDEREEFRRVSYVRAACEKTVAGHGTDGYLEAMDYLAARAAEEEKEAGPCAP